MPCSTLRTAAIAMAASAAIVRRLRAAQWLLLQGTSIRSWRPRHFLPHADRSPPSHSSAGLADHCLRDAGLLHRRRDPVVRGLVHFMFGSTSRGVDGWACEPSTLLVTDTKQVDQATRLAGLRAPADTACRVASSGFDDAFDHPSDSGPAARSRAPCWRCAEPARS